MKSITESKKLAKLRTDGARLLYSWIIPHLDINGCISGDAEVLKGKIFTRLKKSIKTVEDYLGNLEEERLIFRYEAGGDIFLHVPDFVPKQPYLDPKKEGKPTIPLPTKEQLQKWYEEAPDKLQNNSEVTLPQYKYKSKSKSKSKSKDTYMSSQFKNNVIFKWNKLAEEYNLPAIKGIEPGSVREKNLKARAAGKEFDFEFLLKMIENSPFLLGKTKHAFFVFFDWIVKPTNYQKIIEGNYLDRQSYQKFSGIIEGIKELEEKYQKEKKNGA